MSFPTVKSDPWKKGIRPRIGFRLWSTQFWKRLCERARDDQFFKPKDEPRWVSPECVLMIADMNRLLYADIREG
jgi:hypothetical protein